MENKYFDRDVSWLLFNERVLREAGRESMPVGERINFLSIYSSNLDEFFRVRIPALNALHKLSEKVKVGNILARIQKIVDEQQVLYGELLRESIDDLEKNNNIILLYNRPIPEEIIKSVHGYFLTQVMAFLEPVYLSDNPDFFPENNKIYFAVSMERKDKREIVVINIPSKSLGRFFSVTVGEKQYIVLLDDIIRTNLEILFPEQVIFRCQSIKITRDAELNLKDEFGDIAEKIEKQLSLRDFGLATRFLYDSTMSELDLHLLTKLLKLKSAYRIAGARYHNLKELSELPIRHHKELFNKIWIPVSKEVEGTMFEYIDKEDFMLHVPYQNYDTVLRFFNEAAQDVLVSDIFITLYRVASDSRIAHALISAAKNGKNVTVFVELKARFDEANNIRWAKRMKSAGVKIIYSIPGWKVHSKVALVKRKVNSRMQYYGLLGTGNFNENTAKIYTDHILFTSHKGVVRELELLFIFLSKRKKIEENRYHINFHHLLVSQFNLLPGFIKEIDNEIKLSKEGKEASIIIKMNNLEDETLINKLYEASAAGVKIQMIVRGICRLIPGAKGMSENISVRRIVDRYLEHGRIFLFHNGGDEKVFAGSSDWMRRNIYRRIEVCFPIYNEQIRKELSEILKLELSDNIQAVEINDSLENVPVKQQEPLVRSQKAIYEFFSK